MGYLQPRLKDDIGRVVSASAKKNGRSVPAEVDQILRHHFFSARLILGRLGPNGDGDGATPTAAQELGFEMRNGMLYGPDGGYHVKLVKKLPKGSRTGTLSFPPSPKKK